ncbi:hypothetical protein SAMN04515671_4539 [Nakamurella panacisegetis]|uniref:YjbR protein n=1 Tax=Nakamurella panacisegetis TaxID=1090615 RepID=A0A1H0T960_9ACTN|nr:MmcQ/YjbR family DNA-binding protein [Nakamurella panacisegetis]SDP50554.1 hypothetical protein SAMN04515671_4539 [Nakamurella panacisegetis]
MTIDDVAAYALSLPQAVETLKWNHRTWAVAGKSFAWERPFSKADIKRFGSQTPPSGPIAAITVADLSDKEAVLAEHPDSFFTIPHFDGFPAVLVQLELADPHQVEQVVLDAWLCCAPPTLAAEYAPQAD